MFDCKCLIHPFQNDPGTSQNQRIMEELLSGVTRIDARTLPDLLEYFVKLAPHINYYDLDLNVDDWRPFFKNSLPFGIAAIINNPVTDITAKFNHYKALFKKQPGPTGLQLNAFALYYYFILRINNWHLSLKDSKLPIEPVLENLIKDKLRGPVLNYISYTHQAVQVFGIRGADFSPIYNNAIWNINMNELGTATGQPVVNNLDGINKLNDQFYSLFPVFLEVVKSVSLEAKNNLELSLVHSKEEFQKKHQPHLALLFAFLNIFRFLQDDLNQFTRRHLDFFYKDILRFSAGPAIPDRVHVLFEIQKQLKNYMLEKGLLVKGGKDDKKQEMLFGLDGEIVVNKTEILEKRTFFLNNQEAHQQTYVEGIYMAQDATKADGIDKEFQDEISNFPTLGAKNSKYRDPETKIIKPYANGKTGFILASPVLFLEGGTRTITVNIAARLLGSVCSDLSEQFQQDNKSCCDDKDLSAAGMNPGEDSLYPQFLNTAEIHDDIRTVADEQFVYLNEALLREALKKGIKKETVQLLKDEFLIIEDAFDSCYCDVKKYKPEISVFLEDWNDFLVLKGIAATEIEILKEIFEPSKILKIYFSGEKEWIIPKPDGIIP